MTTIDVADLSRHKLPEASFVCFALDLKALHNIVVRLSQASTDFLQQVE